MGINDDLAEACLRLARIRDKKKAVSAEFNRQIKNIEKEIMDLSKKLKEPEDDDEDVDGDQEEDELVGPEEKSE